MMSIKKILLRTAFFSNIPWWCHAPVYLAGICHMARTISSAQGIVAV
jgi:hypothetical protein